MQSLVLLSVLFVRAGRGELTRKGLVCVCVHRLFGTPFPFRLDIFDMPMGGHTWCGYWRFSPTHRCHLPPSFFLNPSPRALHRRREGAEAATCVSAMHGLALVGCCDLVAFLSSCLLSFFYVFPARCSARLCVALLAGGVFPSLALTLLLHVSFLCVACLDSYSAQGPPEVHQDSPQQGRSGRQGQAQEGEWVVRGCVRGFGHLKFPEIFFRISSPGARKLVLLPSFVVQSVWICRRFVLFLFQLLRQSKATGDISRTAYDMYFVYR